MKRDFEWQALAAAREKRLELVGFCLRGKKKRKKESFALVLFFSSCSIWRLLLLLFFTQRAYLVRLDGAQQERERELKVCVFDLRLRTKLTKAAQTPTFSQPERTCCCLRCCCCCCWSALAERQQQQPFNQLIKWMRRFAGARKPLVLLACQLFHCLRCCHLVVVVVFIQLVCVCAERAFVGNQDEQSLSERASKQAKETRKSVVVGIVESGGV